MVNYSTDVNYQNLFFIRDLKNELLGKVANQLEASDLGGDVHNLSLYRFTINMITNQSFVGIVDNQGQKP